jgi:hypothetical protein
VPAANFRRWVTVPLQLQSGGITDVRSLQSGLFRSLLPSFAALSGRDRNDGQYEQHP